ncbi:FtsK/SpoIIIE family DNA translocase [Lacipirellula limnantheis]|uniref:DNA translocase FtsK n=1 Tax=Lacipirellula limnantheis TaxID=2528024 RepID=A0A517TUQ2_9BACT|nr:DNA translocase FtsK [Lacipirellula limnantheis]QDT72104.1 DNA translocase FtsK [Lacipirellula limnantheis]
MFENRSLKLDLLALALLAACAFLGTALATYDPADPPGTLVYPPPAEYRNACGPIGAYAAHALYAGVGFAAYYLLGSLLVISALLLKRREIDQPVLRGVGWAVSLAAFATLFAMLFQQSSPGPEVGAGGYLGAMGFALLESKFATIGAFILALSVLLAGLLLCTDYLLLRFAAKTTVVSGAGLMQLGRVGQRMATLAAHPRRASDLDDVIESEADDVDEGDAETGEQEDEWDEAEAAEGDDEAEEELTLRVKTPSSKQQAAEEEEDLTAIDGDADEAGGDAATAGEKAPGMRAKVAAALTIKNNRIAKPQPKSERDEVMEQLDAAESQGAGEFDYQLPPLDLLLPSDEVSYEEHEKEVRRKAKILEKTFQNFGFNVKVVEIETGPVIAQFEVELEAGLRLSKITGLADDLAIALRVPSVRIVAPIPGKNTVGIEVPNEHRQLVRIREVIEETNGRAKRMKIPIYLGKDVAGNAMAVDLTSLPHLLIAGRTGTGKSVCLNSIIVSMIMSRGPDEVRMLMIDPKMVELSGYRQLPHLMHPVVTDMKKAEAILGWAVDKMEERYALLARAGVRHVTVYNQLGEEELRERIKPTSELEWENIPRNLPFIVIVADEMADLMMTAGKEVEQHIIRLAQKSRAVGIHLILATQKPTVDVITGLIKSNLPARIAFQVASRTDSRVVLDENGADKLLGNGDMLFLSPGTSQLLRGQGTYLSDDEITRVTEFVATDSPQFARELIELKSKDEQAAEMPTPGTDMKSRDELYEAAVDIVVRERRGSVSLLQRCLGIGYGRAARLIDYMAEDGIVGEYNGSQAREVAISIEDWEAMASANKEEKTGEAPAAATTAAPQPLTAANVQPKQRRATKILPGSDEPSDLEEEPTRAKGRGLRLGRAAADEHETDDEDAAVDESDDETPWDEEDEATAGEDEEFEEEDAAEDPETDEDEETSADEEWDDDEIDADEDENLGDSELWDEDAESEWDDEEDADDGADGPGTRAASA